MVTIRYSLSPSRLCNLHSSSTRPFLFSFSSLTPLTPAETHTSIPNSNPFLLNYLIESFGFPKPRALSISNLYSGIKTPEKPQSVIQFFRHLGFSSTHIQSLVRGSPQILFSDVDKTLKPKLQFVQELGLTGSDLGKLISKNPTLLTCSLDRKLKPGIEILKKILTNDDNNEDLFRVLWRCSWVAFRHPESRLVANISYLQSCGIVGSQLSMLLKRQPRLFAMHESALRDFVSRVLDMGFSINSRMLVHAIYIVSCLSKETFRRKFDLFQSFGFSEVECMEMFRRMPGLFGTSEKKLKLGIVFFMNTVKIKKALLVHCPTCLMYSMEGRMIPRYRVLQVLKSKRLLKKNPSFINVLSLPEEEFLEKFISRFRDDALELLVVYKGCILDSSEE